MSREHMPIREYLSGEFNQVVNKHGEDPFEAYVRLETELAKKSLGYDTYAQATITSGGHARNPNLAWIDIVKKNVAYAQAMASELYDSGQLNPRRTIEASTLGLVGHWNENDYITFWLNTLGRPDFIGNGAAQRVDAFRARLMEELAKHDIDFDTFNNYKVKAEERAPYYFKLADSFADALAYTDHSPVERVVAVSETAGSLGASTEKYFAKRLGTRVYGLAIAHLGDQELPSTYNNAHLVQDTKEIVEYGGQIFDPSTQTRVVIVEQ